MFKFLRILSLFPQYDYVNLKKKTFVMYSNCNHPKKFKSLNNTLKIINYKLINLIFLRKIIVDVFPLFKLEKIGH